jgi:hypothetical protein
LALTPETEQFTFDPECDLKGGLRRIHPQHWLARSLCRLALHKIQRIVWRFVVDAQFRIAQQFPDPVRLSASSDHLTGQNRKTLLLVQKLF